MRRTRRGMRTWALWSALLVGLACLAQTAHLVVSAHAASASPASASVTASCSEGCAQPAHHHTRTHHDPATCPACQWYLAVSADVPTSATLALPSAHVAVRPAATPAALDRQPSDTTARGPPHPPVA